MGIIKFLKWLADDDPIKEQKSMVDAAKFEVERLKRNIEYGSNSASTLKELRQKLKQARERLAYEKERLKRLKNKG